MDNLQNGIAAFKSGKHEDARKLFVAAMRENPQNEVVWGWLYQVSKNDKEKIECLSKILAINPNSIKAKQLLGQLQSPSPAKSQSTPILPKDAFLQYPLGIRMMLLMQYDGENYPSFYKEATKLEYIIVNRNAKGIELEKQSKVDEAIALYESNVADFADTPHPYDRLRIIYTKRKQYREAIRVCQAYIKLCQISSNAVLVELGNKELSEQLSDQGKYPEYVYKLESKLIS